MTPQSERFTTRRYRGLPLRRRVRFVSGRRGQAMVESLIVVLVLVGVFLFFLDFSVNVVSRLLLQNASARAARADTVGFNDFQRMKAFRVSMIPVSGKREIPAPERGVTGFASELAFIRAYLQAETFGEANGILRYARWDNLSHTVRRKNHEVHVSARFEIPQQVPHKLAEFFGAAPEAARDGLQPITAEWAIEDHASHYLVR